MLNNVDKEIDRGGKPDCLSSSIVLNSLFADFRCCKNAPSRRKRPHIQGDRIMVWKCPVADVRGHLSVKLSDEVSMSR